jgi:protein SCO1/2
VTLKTVGAEPPVMERRQYLRRVAATGALGAAATAGCASLGGSGGNPNTILPKPELDAEPEAYPYPQWSQQLPEVTLPAALQDRSVTTTEFDTPLALTFIFTNCMTACPVLTLALQRAQRDAIDGGYADAVNFAEISFDPARDTPEAFREYADERHVDLDAGNWYFLLPESEARAREVVDGEFGVYFETATPTPSPTADEPESGPGTPAGTRTAEASPTTVTEAPTGTATTDEASSDGYMFNHTTLILLVNGDNYVERAYRDRNDATTQLTKDVQRLVES